MQACRERRSRSLRRMARLHPPLLRRLLLVLAIAGARAAKPTFAFSGADPDNGDREYSNGDTLTFVFQSDAGGAFRRVAQGAGSPSLTKAQVDALLSFSVSLGDSYTGQWSAVANQFDLLTVTIENKGSSATVPEDVSPGSVGFTATCKTGAVTFADASGADQACSDSNAVSITTANSASDWGRGRPRIANVTSQSAQAALLLSVNDTVRVEFEAPLNISDIEVQSGKTPSDGSAYVDALLQMPQDKLGSVYRPVAR